jgi:acetyltransferase-like isoleucine patch superfamily enzyme
LGVFSGKTRLSKLKLMKNLLYFLGSIFFKPFLFVKIRLVYFINVFYSGVFSSSVKNNPKKLFVDSSYSLKGGNNVSIGNNFVGNKGLVIEALEDFGKQTYSPSIVIGNNVFINQNCRLQCINRIEIGDGTMLAGNIFITDHFHGNTSMFDEQPPAKRSLYSKGAVIIGKSVWIGEGVVIMPNVKIGNHAIIGANAVVTKDVDDYCVVAGIPAKLIKRLKS